MIWLPYGKKVWPYVKPFSSDTGMLRTNGRTDGRTDRFAILISRVTMVTRDKKSKTLVRLTITMLPTVLPPCEWKYNMTLRRYLLLFKNNKLSRGSQGFVGQSSRNVALHVEQPSVLNTLFQNYNILPRSGVRAESLRVGSENTPNFVTFGPPCRLRMTRKKSK